MDDTGWQRVQSFIDNCWSHITKQIIVSNKSLSAGKSCVKLCIFRLDSVVTRLEPSSCPGQSWWTWSLAPWTASDLDLLDKSSDPTTLSLDSQELATTGLRDITQKEPNLWTLSWMLLGRNLKHATVS